jgi:hypothetical protein
MKKILFTLIAVLGTAGIAAAQAGYSPSTDVLGAHLNYGRGCTACHAPHSGASGNGANKSADPNAGAVALWGQDVGNLYNKVLNTGQSRAGTFYVETLPAALTGSTPDVLGLLTCLSCHDGNYATGAMMKNVVYETLPPTYGTFNQIPTLLGGDSLGYLNDHPVGLNAIIGCGGQYNWDCTITAGKINVPSGVNFAQFVQNYGFFVAPGVNGNNPVVVCTTCHNQHLMNVVKVTNGPKTGLASGYYQTMFFILAPYNPASTTAGSNQNAQFCRQCHGGEANESNNGTAGTTF